jgi:hypothetical protein
MTEKIVINNLYDLLNEIRKRPAMYLGSKSLSSLRQFVDGYTVRNQIEGTEDQSEKDFAQLDEFVKDYYCHSSFPGDTTGWCNNILAANYGNEEAALNEFFKLLDLFREGYTAVNTKKVIYHLLHKWIVNKEDVLSAASNDDQIIRFLSDLPLRLMNVESSWHFEEIFYDIKDIAKVNAGLAGIIKEIIGNGYNVVLED